MPQAAPASETAPGPDRDLMAIEELERELAALEHELENVDGTPPATDEARREREG